MRAIGCVILVCALAIPAAALAGQKPKLSLKAKDPTIAQSNLTAYQRLLRRYGSADATAIDTLLSWDRDALHDAVTLINSSYAAARPWPVKYVKAAVLMHTEGTLRLLMKSKTDDDLAYQLDMGSRVLVRGADPFLAQSDFAAAPHHAEVRAFASRWHVAVSRLLRDRTRFNAARNFLTLGRERLPGDPAVLFESGTMEEFAATHPGQTFSRDMAGHMSFPYGDSVVTGLLTRHEQQLADAARWLRESVTHDPACVEAQLHLGRVLMLLGRDDESLRLLDKVVSAGPAAMTYLGWMFRGAIGERRNALDVARQAYSQAIAANPEAQSAAVALSQVLQRQGRGDDSRTLLDQLLTRSTPTSDPWWTYFFEPSTRAMERMQALFTEVDP
jgi:hypothetical protein